MSKLSIRVDIGDVLAAVPTIINESVLPNLSQAVYALADKSAMRWKDGVMKAKLWDGERQAYAASIQWRATGPFSAEVWSEYKNAGEIETGRPSRDLKKMLQTSTKVRETKTGKKYLIIPFRHNTPGNTAHARAMPQDVYDSVSSQSFKKSRVTGKTTRLSASGHTVPQNIYQWGSRLVHNGPLLKPHHTASIYSGMVRFDTSSGGQRSSSYMTFRNMVEGSQGWIVPAKPGLYLMQKVIQQMQPKAEMAFAKAVELDTSPA